MPFLVLKEKKEEKDKKIKKRKKKKERLLKKESYQTAKMSC
jgi:hypothetical protein